MVREIVEHRDAAPDAAEFHAPLHALERRQSFAQLIGVQADRVPDGNRRQRIPHVVLAHERRLERAERVVHGASP